MWHTYTRIGCATWLLVGEWVGIHEVLCVGTRTCSFGRRRVGGDDRVLLSLAGCVPARVSAM